MHTVKADWTSLSDELWCTIFGHVKDFFQYHNSDLLYNEVAQYERLDFFEIRR